MGLKMDDIHNPSIPSCPTTGIRDSANAHSEKSLTDLIAEKDRVESELVALSSVLDSHGVNMNTSLTTFDGYPRDDLDIAQIRTTRARIIYIRNDYKNLMSGIEAGLHVHHATSKNSAPASLHSSSSTSMPNAASRITQDSRLAGVAFAKVNSIVAGSPADDAGLKAGDAIIHFGNVNWMNHEKLGQVAEAVQRNEGSSIVVKIARSDAATGSSEELQLNLTPRRNWGGRGMLGCHLLPA